MLPSLLTQSSEIKEAKGNVSKLKSFLLDLGHLSMEVFLYLELSHEIVCINLID